MTDDLRPIGSEFEYWAEPDKISSKQCWTLFTYRVVAHDKIAGGRQANRVEAVKIREYPSAGLMLLGTSFIPIPPPEIRHMIPGWDRFIA